MGFLAPVAVVLGAVAAVGQGVAARRQADAQARFLQQQAVSERQAAAIEAEDFRRGHQRLFAARRAAAGGSGIQFSTGTPLLASMDFVSEAELQRLRILHGGELAATRLQQQAGLIKKSGRSAQTLGLLRGGASLLAGLPEFGGSTATFGRVPFAPGTGPSGRI